MIEGRAAAPTVSTLVVLTGVVLLACASYWAVNSNGFSFKSPLLRVHVPDTNVSAATACNASAVQLPTPTACQPCNVSSVQLPMPTESQPGNLSSVQLPTPAACSPEDAIAQAGIVRAILQSQAFTRQSSCPSFAYLLDVAATVAVDSKEDLVMLDIGCNKGYDTAAAFELWRPSIGLARGSLGDFISKTRGGRNDLLTVRGVCSDSMASFGEAYKSYSAPPAYPKQRGGLKVHCFEPSALNYDLLQQVHTHFFGNLTSDEAQRLQVHRLAFSNATGTTFFSSNCNTELCHIQSTAQNSDVVNVTTVDAMLERLQLNKVFIVKVDTEGFDPLVLQGAKNALAAHKVTILQFEYHQLNAWRNSSLESVTKWLDSLGYVCYLDGKVLALLTGCWDPQLEFRQWSNVVCTIKGHPVHRVLATYSLAPFEGRYRATALQGT